MDEFDEDPLDLLEDDGEGVIDSILLLDDEKANPAPRGWGSGCGLILLAVPSSLLATGLAIYHMLA